MDRGVEEKVKTAVVGTVVPTADALFDALAESSVLGQWWVDESADISVSQKESWQVLKMAAQLEK